VSGSGSEGARPWLVIVAWNAAARLPATLGALASLSGEFDLVLVDNASTDGSAEIGTELWPRAHVIRNRANAGFAAASNQGIDLALASGATHVGLVNDDMRLDPRWLGELLAESARHPEAGVFGGVVLFRERPDTINSTGLVRDAFWRVRDRDLGKPRSELRDLVPSDVDGVSGGAMLLTRAALEAVGWLDASFFAYFEDFDLCVRVRDRGFTIRFVPSALSWHDFAASTGPKSSLRERLLARNHLQIVGRYAPLALVLPLLVGIALARGVVRAPLALLRGSPALAGAEIRGACVGIARGLRELGRRLGSKS
jgi:N-acetylglucosaminyl-diphospho-decaprenol L-rhamnosyltransferase